MEVTTIRKDLEEVNLEFEQNISALRRKHNEHSNELTDQIDQLNKAKAKYETLI